jgi:hypothetical protein
MSTPKKKLTVLRRTSTTTARFSVFGESVNDIDPDNLPGWLVVQLDALEAFLVSAAPFLRPVRGPVRTFISEEALTKENSSQYDNRVLLADPDNDFVQSKVIAIVRVVLPYAYSEAYYDLAGKVCGLADDCLCSGTTFESHVAQQLHHYHPGH